jgi:hypothetical protein
VIGREQQTKQPATGTHDTIMSGIQGFFPDANTRSEPRNSTLEQLVFKTLTSAEELDVFSAPLQFAGTD